MPRTKRTLLAIIAVLMLPTIALGAWDIVIDPATSNPEATWSNQPSGQSTSDILFSYLDGSTWSPSVTISHEGSNTSSPRLAIDASGNRSVTWESSDATPTILISTLSAEGGSWSSARTLSDTDESSRAPAIALLGSDTFVAYEVVAGSGGRIVKVSKADTSGGVARTLVQSTANTAELKVLIHSESGHLWLDWVDGEGVMGYSEYLSGDWTSAETWAFDNDLEIPAVRNKIRGVVVGG